MSAQMIVAAVAMPRYPDGPDGEPRHCADPAPFMARMTPEKIAEARRMLISEDLHFALLDTEQQDAVLDTEDPVQALPDELVLAIVHDALVDTVLMPDHPEYAALLSGQGLWLLVTGGMSWGDLPTEVCEATWFLGSLGITEEAVEQPQQENQS